MAVIYRQSLTTVYNRSAAYNEPTLSLSHLRFGCKHGKKVYRAHLLLICMISHIEHNRSVVTLQGIFFPNVTIITAKDLGELFDANLLVYCSECHCKVITKARSNLILTCITHLEIQLNYSFPASVILVVRW